MANTLPLDKMSVEEKIQAMESLWDDLCSKANGVTSPNWHKDVLAERDEVQKRGDAKFEDWDTAKRNNHNQDFIRSKYSARPVRV